MHGRTLSNIFPVDNVVSEYELDFDLFSIALDSSDMDYALESLNKYRSINVLNMTDTFAYIKNYPLHLYEDVYIDAYGENYRLNPRPSSELHTSFAKVIGNFLFTYLVNIPNKQRSFYWILVPTSEDDLRARKILFIRHGDSWITILEKDWKLAFSYATVDENDEDVQSCVLYSIITTFLTDVIRGFRPHQVALAQRRVIIPDIKALIDTEDNKVLTKMYWVKSVLLDSHFCLNSLDEGMMLLPMSGANSPNSAWC
jgi:hypothetical protein